MIKLNDIDNDNRWVWVTLKYQWSYYRTESINRAITLSGYWSNSKCPSKRMDRMDMLSNHCLVRPEQDEFGTLSYHTHLWRNIASPNMVKLNLLFVLEPILYVYTYTPKGPVKYIFTSIVLNVKWKTTLRAIHMVSGGRSLPTPAKHETYCLKKDWISPYFLDSALL